jgi:FkbM family methyltransferase
MFSALGFLRTIREGTISAIKFGIGLKNKLTLVLAVMLGSAPNVERSIPLLRNVARIADLLARGKIIRVYGIYYVLVDLDSLFILSPNFEKELWSYLRIKKGDTFIDVGAHVGKYSMIVARLVGKEGLVIAIEPYQKNYEAILRAIELNRAENLVALNVAAHNEDTNLKLFLSYSASGGSTQVDKGLGYVWVRGVKLDNVIKSMKVKHIDWVKVDVEGNEMNVLEGMKNILKMFRPRLIVEVKNENIKAFLRFIDEVGHKGEVISGQVFRDAVYFFCEPLSE